MNPHRTYDANGKVTEEYWSKNSLLHRLDGPAIVRYRNGQVFKEEWYVNGDWVPAFSSPVELLASVVRTFDKVPKNVRTYLRQYFTDKEAKPLINSFRAATRIIGA